MRLTSFGAIRPGQTRIHGIPEGLLLQFNTFAEVQHDGGRVPVGAWVLRQRRSAKPASAPGLPQWWTIEAACSIVQHCDAE